MKTKMLFFAVLVTVSSTALAFGSDGPGMTVVSVKGSEVFRVIYKSATIGRVTLNVLDGQGKKIHSERIYGVDGFILPLNFKGLQSGNYTIELVDGAGTQRKEVAYFPTLEKKSIHVSKILGDEGKFLLAIANAQNEPIDIKIYDDSERVVHSESKIVSGDFAQVYKIQDAHSRFTFEVADAGGNKKYFSFR